MARFLSVVLLIMMSGMMLGAAIRIDTGIRVQVYRICSRNFRPRVFCAP